MRQVLTCTRRRLNLASCDQEEYPRESPAFTISMSKGLGDDDLSFLENGIAACAHELWGSAEAEPVAMGCVSLVEAASNCLDELNCKSACQVCLMPLFEEQEQHQCGPPMRTACYHPFHTECLAEWWVRCERSEKVSRWWRWWRCCPDEVPNLHMQRVSVWSAAAAVGPGFLHRTEERDGGGCGMSSST